VTQNQETKLREVLTNIEQTVHTVTQNQITVQCVVLTDRGQTLEDSSEHRDTEPTDCTL